MVLNLPDKRALSQEEKTRRLTNYKLAEAKAQQAQADFDKIKAGTWKPDIEIAQSQVEQAKENVERVKSELQRTTMTSPIDGVVLQLNVRVGEISPHDPNKPLMILGNIDDLHLRVNINQLDIPYFRPDATAVAFLRNDATREFKLEFVRIDPYLVNKSDLTNDITEIVDTRMLPIIYRIKPQDYLLYVGEQMDAYIDTTHTKE